jgi:DNA repair exonuclease SbcCD ATPase subunit
LYLQLESLKFKNLFSVGSKPITINFDKGLHLISGTNGTGKSTIIDALCYNWFGKPYRKITIKELINRTNKKNLYTETQFNINGNQYKIIRTLKKDSITIEKNGKPLELLSSKSLIQDDIEKILGINYQMFKQIISLAVNYNQPYLTLSLDKKREILESVFGITVFGKMLKQSKKNTSNLKSQHKLYDQEINFLETNLKTIKSNLQESKNIKKDFEKVKENNSQKLNNKLSTFGEDKSLFLKSISQLETELKSLKVEDDTTVADKLKLCEKRINLLEFNINNTQQEIEFLNNNDVCSQCNQKIDESFKKENIDKHSKKLTNYEETKSQLLGIKQKLQDKITTINENNSKINDIKMKLSQLKTELSYLEKDIERTRCELEENDKKTFTVDVDKKEQDFNYKVKEYKESYKKYKNNQEELDISLKTSEILSDNGIKKYVFEKMIPLLNEKINKYIQQFELPIRLEFSETMDEKIVNLTNLSKNISYYSFSAGEQQRINISILLSFIDITKMICNWSTNILIIDELLDGSVDDLGLDKMIYCLKGLVDNSNLNIYVISHRLKNSDIFDGVLRLEKKHDFTELIEN